MTKVGVELFPLNIKDPAIPFDERDKLGMKQVEIDPTRLSVEEIHELIDDYAAAAERVMKAGGGFYPFPRRTTHSSQGLFSPESGTSGTMSTALILSRTGFVLPWKASMPFGQG